MEPGCGGSSVQPCSCSAVWRVAAVFFAALFVPILVEYHQFVTVLPHLLWTAIGAGALGAALIEVNAHRNRRWQKRNYPELEVAPLNFFPAK